jgi:hypothetical protein
VATAVVLAAVEANPRQIAAAMRPALTFAADELARAAGKENWAPLIEQRSTLETAD